MSNYSRMQSNSSTTITLVPNDSGTFISATASTAISIPLPASSTSSFAIGSYIDIMQAGTGQITVTAPSGTLTAPGSKSSKQYGVIRIISQAPDYWLMSGDLI